MLVKIIKQQNCSIFYFQFFCKACNFIVFKQKTSNHTASVFKTSHKLVEFANSNSSKFVTEVRNNS